MKTNMEFSELQQIVESNSRAIQALADRIAEIGNDIAEVTEIQRNAAEERAELRQATIGITNLLSSLDSDRPTILRKLNSIENKVDRLLEGES
jgi:ABC-type transporter Mla subunit MlaD